MLQACGLLTAVVNAVVATVADPRAIWLPSQVLLAVLVFAVVLFAAGKAFFYAFSVALAKAVDMQVSHRPSVAMVTLIVCGSAVIATLLSLEITEGKALSTLTEVLTAGIAYVVAVCVFGTLYVTGRYLRRLRAAVKEYNIRPADVEVESS